ncbi:hypothetical protein DDB_G0271474 [Dictyostelium discoideum AX4]|uniref:Uncharacterized protein n=1 Tax=Dictyostelium discoideum TaxID=44689 RepID=Q55B18_DICDI|nr:hypothetical protein DDB_G0271474 [Dictyostelium discoideum AX4]EAL71867.1 hypothetical protein DDB_G0271474 [Dictyostelium discoideum AX4]|eukprot:XP_645794.1 hypothetical protein DDB_G0271474 [Dictyostelium discoideum AX4]
MSTNNNNNNNNNNEDIDNDESQQQDNEEQQLQQPQVSTFNEQQCQIREQQEKLTLMTLTTSCYKLKFVRNVIHHYYLKRYYIQWIYSLVVVVVDVVYYMNKK